MAEGCSEVCVTGKVTTTFIPQLKTKWVVLGHVPLPCDVFVTTSPGRGN